MWQLQKDDSNSKFGERCDALGTKFSLGVIRSHARLARDGSSVHLGDGSGRAIGNFPSALQAFLDEPAHQE